MSTYPIEVPDLKKDEVAKHIHGALITARLNPMLPQEPLTPELFGVYGYIAHVMSVFGLPDRLRDAEEFLLPEVERRLPRGDSLIDTIALKDSEWLSRFYKVNADELLFRYGLLDPVLPQSANFKGFRVGSEFYGRAAAHLQRTGNEELAAILTLIYPRFSGYVHFLQFARNVTPELRRAFKEARPVIDVRAQKEIEYLEKMLAATPTE